MHENRKHTETDNFFIFKMIILPCNNNNNNNKTSKSKTQQLTRVGWARAEVCCHERVWPPAFNGDPEPAATLEQELSQFTHHLLILNWC